MRQDKDRRGEEDEKEGGDRDTEERITAGGDDNTEWEDERTRKDRERIRGKETEGVRKGREQREE